MEERDLPAGEYAVLGFLALEQAHGYELHRRWQASPLAEVLPVEQSVLYGYLRTLDRRGLLDWEEHRVGNRPLRKIYRPSERGEEFLRPWLRSPVHHLHEVRLDFLLKLHILGQLDAASAASLVERQIAICEDLRDEARRSASAATDPTAFGALFQGSRVAAAEATLLWLRAYRGERHKRERAS